MYMYMYVLWCGTMWLYSQEILQGVTWFNEILEKHRGVKFPLAYLGLGNAYRTQNRCAVVMPVK